MNLTDARFALSGDVNGWSLRESLAGVWPAMVDAGTGTISTRDVMRRFSAPGRELRKLGDGGADRWPRISRATVVPQARQRLRNPASFDQEDTELCGAFVLLFEFARREPTLYVKALAELLERGTFTTKGGHVFEAEDDLRARPAASISAADWLIAATIRDEENVTEDVNDGQDMEGFTWPTEIQRWIQQILGLRAELYNVYNSDEMDAIRAAHRAIQAGGVAVLLIDNDMIKEGAGHREEAVWWRRRTPPSERWGARQHARDDNDVIPGHYVVLLGDVTGTDEDGRRDFSMRLWSWGREYEVTGSAEGVSEYVYWVMTGVP